MRLWLRDELREIEKYLIDLLQVVAERAEQDIDYIMPGYTHLQRAQVIRTYESVEAVLITSSLYVGVIGYLVTARPSSPTWSDYVRSSSASTGLLSAAALSQGTPFPLTE